MPTVKRLTPFECQELIGHCWPHQEIVAGASQFCRHCSLKRTMQWVEEPPRPSETKSSGRGK